MKIVADFSLEELSALLGCQGMGESQHMLHAGLGSIAIKETVDQAAAYLGIGRVHNFLEATNQIMEQHGVTMTRLPQGTTDEASRFAKRLKRQMELLENILQSSKPIVPLCAEKSTIGWQITVLATIE